MQDQAAPGLRGLALPFALAGAATGLFALAGLSALRSDATLVSPWLAASVGGLLCGALGAGLARWRALADPMLTVEAGLARLLVPVVATGALAGMVLGTLTRRFGRSAPFALDGALVALLFLPAAWWMIAAARGEPRPRAGSLLADAERRGVWATSLRLLLLSSMAGLPAVAVGCVPRALSVPQQLSLSLGASVLVAVGALLLRQRDRAAQRRLASVSAAVVYVEQAHERAEARDVIDAGVGDELWRAESRSSDYRVGARGAALLRGDPDLAAQKLGRALRSRERLMGLCTATMLAHLGVGLAVDTRALGDEGCLRRVRSELAMCECVDASHFPPLWQR